MIDIFAAASLLGGQEALQKMKPAEPPSQSPVDQRDACRDWQTYCRALPWGKLMRYGKVTLLSFVVNIGGTAFLHEVVGLPEEVAFAIALVVLLTMNYYLLGKYVYRAEGGQKSHQMKRYLLAAMGFRAVEYVLFLLLFHLTPLHYLVVIWTNAVVMTILKYFGWEKLVFRGSKSCS